MTSLNIGVVGAGYVGLTTAVCMAERGHDVVAVDVDAARVEALQGGRTDLAEPDLDAVLQQGMSSGLLRFSTVADDLADRDLVFVCVPTPSADDGSVDLRAVDSVIDSLAGLLAPRTTVALKSTVPVGTTRRTAERLSGNGIRVVSTPEFLREGHAVDDFRHPDRWVVGAVEPADAEVVCASLGTTEAPVLTMSPESAEMAKYASNAFLAVKLSYANSLSELCWAVGADIVDVVACMGSDSRIGEAFLRPGPGWGGSCLPKDTAALVDLARTRDVELAEVEASRMTNSRQAERISAVLTRELRRPLASARVAALGLTFKAGTGDTRDSPALAVCTRLASRGAQVHGFDPQLAGIDTDVLVRAGITAVDDPYRAAKDADAVVILTEWPEFAELDWLRVSEQAPDAIVVDTRNAVQRSVVERAGLRYLGNGRPSGF